MQVTFELRHEAVCRSEEGDKKTLGGEWYLGRGGGVRVLGTVKGRKDQ